MSYARLVYPYRRGTSTENIKVIVEHPNGQSPYVTDLTTAKEEHRVEADKGEGGFTYKVCFQSFQAKERKARVEVRDERVFTQRAIPFDGALLLLSVTGGVDVQELRCSRTAMFKTYESVDVSVKPWTASRCSVGHVHGSCRLLSSDFGVDADIPHSMASHPKRNRYGAGFSRSPSTKILRG